MHVIVFTSFGAKAEDVFAGLGCVVASRIRRRRRKIVVEVMLLTCVGGAVRGHAPTIVGGRAAGYRGFLGNRFVKQAIRFARGFDFKTVL